MTDSRTAGPPLCPSAHSNAAGARLFGVQVRGADGTRQLAYFKAAEPITERVLALAGDAPAHQVLRVAAHCIEGRCPHWDGAGCRLATRVATMLPPAVSAMPRCAIRPACVWFRQEGPRACIRCPQVATIEQHAPDELRAAVAELLLADDDVVLRSAATEAPVPGDGPD